MTTIIDPKDIPLPKSEGQNAVEDVRDAFRELLAKGEAITCPCCGGETKIYARGIYKKMVVALFEIGKRGALTPSQLSAITAGGEYSMLGHWGLIEHREKSGSWAITSKGWRFLKGEIELPHKVLIFQGTVLGFDTSKTISVHDVKKLNLDLGEVLSAWGETGAQVAAE